MKSVRVDLMDRLAMLDIRYSVTFGLAPLAGSGFEGLADVLIAGLRAQDPPTVAQVRAVVDPADLTSAAFWTTALGRLLFAAGGYGDDAGTVGQAFAAGVLGCTRQYVYELVAKGRLTRLAGSLVQVGQVREMLKMRA